MDREQRNLRALALRDSIHSLGRRTAHGGMVAIVSQVLRLVVQIGGAAVMSRILAPSDFGLIAMAATVTSFIGIFTDMGLSTATIQRPVINQELVSTLFFVNLIVGFALMVAAVIAAPIAAWFFSDPRVLLIVIGLSVAIPLSAAGAQHGALLLRGMRMVAVQAIAVFSQVIALLVAVYLALKTDAGYLALVAQTIIAAAAALCLNWWAADWRPSLSVHFGRAKGEIKFGIYLAGFNFMNYFHRQFDNVLIGWRYGSVELGYYSRAYNLLTMPINVVNASLAQVALPSLARLNTDLPRWRAAFLQLLSAACFGSVGLCAILFVDVEPLVHLLLGEKWTPVIVLLQCLTVASIFGSTVHGCGWAFISLGHSRAFFWWGVVASPFFVLSYALGLPWGARGVATAYSVCMAINAPIYLAFTAHVAGFRFREAAWRLLPPLLAAGATCYLGTLLLDQLAIASTFWRLVAATGLGGGLYGAMALGLLLLPQYADLRAMIVRIISTRKVIVE